MAFDLEFPAYVEDYLDALPVSQGVRDKIADAIEMVAKLSDDFRADRTNRWSDSLLKVSYIFLTPSDRRLHVITFAVDDTKASYGVLRIPHARYTPGNTI